MSKSAQSNNATLVRFALKPDDGSATELIHGNGKPTLSRLDGGSLSGRLKQHLLGLKEGDRTTSALELDVAFSMSSPDLIRYFSRRKFMDAGEPEIDAITLFTTMDGSEMPDVTHEISGGSITADFNHPLVGHTVHFDIEVLKIEPALEV